MQKYHTQKDYFGSVRNSSSAVTGLPLGSGNKKIYGSLR